MTFAPTRRHLAALLGGLAAVPLLRGAGFAERYIDVRGGGDFKPVNVAVAPFAGDSGAAMSSIVVNNFKRSVFLNPVETGDLGAQSGRRAESQRRARRERPICGHRPVRTRRRTDEDRIPALGCRLGRRRPRDSNMSPTPTMRAGSPISFRTRFSRRSPAKRAIFDTRVAFVDESGPRENRRKRLSIMDQDGANVRHLTRGDDLVVTPRFSPNSQELTYMAFGSEDPRVFLLNIDTGQREVVGNFPGMTFSPRFSPDGQRVVMSLSQAGAANLYTMDLRTRATTRLTNTSAIDTSPSYSPDGSKIVFESDRGGAQQIYVMGAGGGAANRISFGEGRYSTPVWSPKGDYIAFTRQGGGGFAIGVMKPDGSGERILTEGFHNEGPSWAPNGLFVMFFRNGGGGPKLFMADIFGRGEFPVPTPGFASDPSWSPLLG